jgi:environmental stress-induced protein Ves
MMRAIVRAIDVPPQKWRNGGGMTRELLAWPVAGDWQVRISVADIESDGPFSAFPGVERWFTVLQGAGVDLTVAGTAHSLRRGDAPLRFDGGATTRCRLIDGPTRDLNLMLRDAGGTMLVAADGQAWSPAAQACGLFTAVAGQCRAGTSRFDLPAYSLLWFDIAPPALTFDAGQRPAALIGWWLAAAPREGAQ